MSVVAVLLLLAAPCVLGHAGVARQAHFSVVDRPTSPQRRGHMKAAKAPRGGRSSRASFLSAARPSRSGAEDDVTEGEITTPRRRWIAGELPLKKGPMSEKSLSETVQLTLSIMSLELLVGVLVAFYACSSMRWQATAKSTAHGTERDLRQAIDQRSREALKAILPCARKERMAYERSLAAWNSKWAVRTRDYVQHDMEVAFRIQGLDPDKTTPGQRQMLISLVRKTLAAYSGLHDDCVGPIILETDSMTIVASLAVLLPKSAEPTMCAAPYALLEALEADVGKVENIKACTNGKLVVLPFEGPFGQTKAKPMPMDSVPSLEEGEALAVELAAGEDGKTPPLSAREVGLGMEAFLNGDVVGAAKILGTDDMKKRLSPFSAPITAEDEAKNAVEEFFTPRTPEQFLTPRNGVLPPMALPQVPKVPFLS